MNMLCIVEKMRISTLLDTPTNNQAKGLVFGVSYNALGVRSGKALCQYISSESVESDISCTSLRRNIKYTRNFCSKKEL